VSGVRIPPTPATGITVARPPAIMACRDLRSLRMCLTYFRVLKGQAGGATCVLDFEKVTWVDPGAIALLHHLMRVYKTPDVRILLPTKATAREYVLKHLKVRSPDNTRYTVDKKPIDYPLRYVPSARELGSNLGEWAKMLEQWEGVPEEDARGFSATMSEVLMNSFQHGAISDPAIIAGQTFVRTGHSLLVAVDNGQGIPGSLRGSGRYGQRGYKADHEWIAAALERGVTCKSSTTNMGYGLYILADQVRRNGGRLIICSGAGVLVVDGKNPIVAEPLDNEHYRTFPGTMLILELQAGAT
jgi:hypothetical protein